MIFYNSYFEDEVRDGFFVPAEIKQAWAAELEVLSEVDRICKKHHIQYFADWGTLLAAVRHEGFIPWDDDLDIVMKRADYIKFMEVAQTELPEGFSAYNFRNHDDLWLFLGRVVGKRRICFEENHLERFHQFPYIAGVDVFVLDYVSRDPEKEKERDEFALHTIALADMIGDGRIQPDLLEQELKKIEYLCDVQISRGLSSIEMRRKLYEVVELIFGWFQEDEADELTQLFPFGLKPDGYRVSKKCYEQAIELPYENMRIPVPVQYCEMLEKKYGNYMRLVRDAGGHDYPFFETQKKQLQAVLDFEMPAYKFSEDQLQVEKDSTGYKELLKRLFNNLQKMVCDIKQNWKMEEAQGKDAKLQNMQQTAIDMGTLIEEMKGEGTQTVTQLEELCELIYECSIAYDQSETAIFKLVNLQDKTEQIKQTLQKELLDRKEVVFFIDKAEHWQYIQWYWEKIIVNENFDVYIVPVPYYYKKYDGSCYAFEYELDEIKKCIINGVLLADEAILKRNHVEDYRVFDIRQHHPDQIVIQNPYDEWNQAITLPEEYYSRNLQKYTEQLVYIQPFQVEPFTKDNYREYHNMQYYCTMPGVVRADSVYVPSEAMRTVYIQKLTEFAGEHTKDIWEKKIFIAENEKKKPEVQSVKNRRKRIAFYVQVGQTIQYGEEMLEKLESVVEIFRESKNKVELVWISDKEHECFLQQQNKGLAERIDDFKRKFEKENWGLHFDREEASVAQIVAMCDAYYGSASHIALEFEVKKKPVMIMDVEIR